MAKLVSKTYGDALFELALEENKIDSLQEEVVVVLEVLAENQDLGKLMNHPKIAKEEKTALPWSIVIEYHICPMKINAFGKNFSCNKHIEIIFLLF